MSHMVIFRTGEAKTAYHQAESIEEAVRFAERLRNAEGVDQVRIFRLEEVVFEYRPYYRIEIGPHAHAPAKVEAPAEPARAEAPVEAPVAENPVEKVADKPVEKVEGVADPLAAIPTPVPVEVPDQNGKRSLFNR